MQKISYCFHAFFFLTLVGNVQSCPSVPFLIGVKLNHSGLYSYHSVDPRMSPDSHLTGMRFQCQSSLFLSFLLINDYDFYLIIGPLLHVIKFNFD